MVANLIAELGVYLGDDQELLPAAADNPRGFFEHTAFVDLNERLLSARSADWTVQLPPLAASEEADAAVRRDAEALIERISERADGRPWGFKDPRTTVLLDFWHSLLPELRLIAVIRHPDEVQASLRARGETHFDAYDSWFAYNLAVFDALEQGPVLVTAYDGWFQQPARELERIAGFLELQQDEHVVDAVVDPTIRHGIAHATDELPAHVALLYGFLRRATREPRDALLASPDAQAVRAARAAFGRRASVREPLEKRLAKIERDIADYKSGAERIERELREEITMHLANATEAQRRAQEAQHRAQEAQHRAQEAQHRAQQAETDLDALRSSTGWQALERLRRIVGR